jgi:outer membrane protein OmpA-like peptidoglycan-associated protein
MEYLSVDGGVKASRIKFKGYGETKPKVPNDSSINRNKNRRTDFLIL